MWSDSSASFLLWIEQTEFLRAFNMHQGLQLSNWFCGSSLDYLRYFSDSFEVDVQNWAYYFRCDLTNMKQWQSFILWFHFGWCSKGPSLVSLLQGCKPNTFSPWPPPLLKIIPSLMQDATIIFVKCHSICIGPVFLSAQISIWCGI